MEYDIFDDYYLEEEAIIGGKRTYLVVVMYDITNNKRRYHLAKLLKGYGIWVQRSVFECILTEEKYNKLIRAIEKFVKFGDLIRIYRLAGNTSLRVWGEVGFTEEEDTILI